MSKRIANRKALIKLIGKEVRYSAVFNRRVDGSVMLVNVKHKGKIVTDHIWIGYSPSVALAKEGDYLSFLGTADSYKDSKGNRKYGIKRCYRFHFDDKSIDAVKKDNIEKFKRLKK